MNTTTLEDQKKNAMRERMAKARAARKPKGDKGENANPPQSAILPPTSKEIQNFGTPERSMKKDKEQMRNIWENLKCRGMLPSQVAKVHKMDERDVKTLYAQAEKEVQDGTLFAD